MGNIFLHTTANRSSSSKRMNYKAVCMLLLIIPSVISLLVLPEHVFAQPLADHEAASFDPHEQVGHSHSSANREDGGITVEHALFYAVRAIYYFAFMLAAGIMLWSIALSEGVSKVQRKLADKWGLFALRGLLLAVLLFVFIHISHLLKGYEGSSPNEWLRLLTETETGQSWLGLITLSFLGFVVLRLHDSFKIIWALLLAAVESFNGHVNALPANTLAVVLDFIHLVCSALWAGGLLLLLLFWYADRKEAGRFAERFAKAAWLTILLLTASGIAMTVLLLPSWRYLLFTSWGLMLLAKAGLVLFIAGIGFLLHRRAKQRELPSGKLLKLDGLLMSVVLLIVSVFTYLSPAPETEPLSYHKMGENLHFTLNITPNGPGPNRVKLKVWLPEQLGTPASVQLQLRADDHPQRVSIKVPLQSSSRDDDISYPGFRETDYKSDQFDLPTRGAWTAEVLIVDQSGLETKQFIEFRND